MNQNVKGFSKLSKEEKINWITSTYFSNPIEAKESLLKYFEKDRVHRNRYLNQFLLALWCSSKFRHQRQKLYHSYGY